MDNTMNTVSEVFLEAEKNYEKKDLVNCKNCGRHFIADRIQLHQTICQKMKKRKPFDVGQQRVKGTEAEKFYHKNKSRFKAESAPPPLPQPDWRKQHEDFIKSLRAAKEMSAHLKKGGNPRDLPPPPPLDYSDYIPCPTCQRKFNSSAAQRHIPLCAEQQRKRAKATNQKTPVKPAAPKMSTLRGK